MPTRLRAGVEVAFVTADVLAVALTNSILLASVPVAMGVVLAARGVPCTGL